MELLIAIALYTWANAAAMSRAYKMFKEVRNTAILGYCPMPSPKSKIIYFF